MFGKSFKKPTGVLAALIIALLSGCGADSQVQGSLSDVSSKESVDETEMSSDADAELTESVHPDLSPDAVEAGTAFQDPFVEGTLWYTVEDCSTYQDISQAGIEQTALTVPHNLYSSQDLGEQYQTISDYIQEQGIVTDTHRLVVLDITIRNEDALGLFKKNEFNILDLCLYGGKPVSQYYAAYFSEAGKANREEPFYYVLEQGQEIRVQIAYLVLKDDMDNLTGMINETQFNIYD